MSGIRSCMHYIVHKLISAQSLKVGRIMDDVAFLSVRVPRAAKRHVKQIAARRGVSIQNLIGGLVDDFVDRETRAQPSLADTISRLRRHKPVLRKLGVAHVDLFGSIVRDEAHGDSDIDVVVEFEKPRGMSLSRFAALRGRLESILGHDVDLAEGRSLRPDIKREFRRDALRVF